MTTKEFSLLVDLMLTVSKKCGEGELTKILEKYQADSQSAPKTEKPDTE